MDFTDRVTGEEVDFDTLDDEIRSACESALDQILEWNDSDAWSDTEEVILQRLKKDGLTIAEDVLLYSTETAEFVSELCK